MLQKKETEKEKEKRREKRVHSLHRESLPGNSNIPRVVVLRTRGQGSSQAICFLI